MNKYCDRGRQWDVQKMECTCPKGTFLPPEESSSGDFKECSSSCTTFEEQKACIERVANRRNEAGVMAGSIVGGMAILFLGIAFRFQIYNGVSGLYRRVFPPREVQIVPL